MKYIETLGKKKICLVHTGFYQGQLLSHLALIIVLFYAKVFCNIFIVLIVYLREKRDMLLCTHRSSYARKLVKLLSQLHGWFSKKSHKNPLPFIHFLDHYSSNNVFKFHFSHRLFFIEGMSYKLFCWIVCSSTVCFAALSYIFFSQEGIVGIN